MKPDKNFGTLIIILSIVVPALVGLLLFLPSKSGIEGDWVTFLPHFNGMLNSTTVILLLIGFFMIKRGHISYHKVCMVSSFILGTIFLISYIIYHASMPGTPFGGGAPIKYFYYFFLISHILLSIVVVPLVLFAFYFALSGKIDRHKKIVKFTLPVWLYVSITGVIVYFMISPYYGS
jgi:putative membrane protein